MLLKDHDYPLLDLKLKLSAAMYALLQGRARKDDMDRLVTMSNICEALGGMGVGIEYADVGIAGRQAIIDIAHRATKHGKFTPTGLEIGHLNKLLELFDAQLDVTTVKMMEEALRIIDKRMKNSATIKLPKAPDDLR